MNRGELETLHRRLESEIKKVYAQKENLEYGADLLKREIRRVEVRLDELTAQMLFVIEELRKKV